MAGFFGLFDYTKEGPGVDPNEPQKGPFLEFFTLYFRKFWKIILLSVMFVIFNLPGILLSLYLAQILLPSLFPGLSLENLIAGIEAQKLQLPEELTVEMIAGIMNVAFMVILSLGLCGLQFFVVGPSQAGLTYIHRNYARGEHAFLWMDFRDTFRANWKQALVNSIVASALCFLAITAYYFYGTTLTGVLATMLRTLLILMLFILTVVQMYSYQIMITFDLPLKYVWKNALLFAILRLPFNLGIFIVLLLINFVVPVGIFFLLPHAGGLLLVMFYFLVFAFGFSMFLINYFVNRQLQRFMIQPLLAQQAAEEAAEEEEWIDEYDEERESRPEEEEDEDETAEESPEGQSYPGHAPA